MTSSQAHGSVGAASRVAWRVRVAADVADAFPELRVSGLVASDLDGAGESAALATYRDAAVRAALEGDEAARVEIARWREVYRRMGVKPSDVRCSFESLHRSAVRGRAPFGINAAVDAYNAVSLRHRLPMGAYDVARLEGDVELRFARAGESLVPIGGGRPIELDERAVVYADRARVLCAYWNHRDADETKVEPSTRAAIFFVDEATAEPGRARAALADLGDLLARACGASVVGTFELDGARMDTTVEG